MKRGANLGRYRTQDIFDELIRRCMAEGHNVSTMFIDYTGGHEGKVKYGYAVLSTCEANIVTTSYSVKEIIDETDEKSEFERVKRFLNQV